MGQHTGRNHAVGMRIRRRHNGRQVNLALDAKEIQQGIIIAQGLEIDEHGAGSVCGIRDKDVGADAPVQTVDQPRIDGAKRQRPALERLPHARDVRQHPEQLGR